MSKPNRLPSTSAVTASDRSLKECPYLVQLGDDVDPFLCKADIDLYNLEDKDECQKRFFS